MPKLAVLFPGQGAQEVGMGQDLRNLYPEAYSAYRKADATLGFALSEMVEKGPAQDLNLTPYTQPAILATSLAYWHAWQEHGVKADAALGLSLGEYSALAAVDALPFDDAVRLVHERGKAMDNAYPANQGAVVVVLGLERDMVQSICDAEAQEGSWVQAANFNSPGQVVIAGDREAVDRAMAKLQTAGAKRLLPLPVSAPFHTRLLKSASEAFRPHLQRADFRLPQVPVLCNVTGQVYENVGQLRELLARQISEPIEFQRAVETLLNMGYKHFLELGPGSTIGGMVKKISREAIIYRASTAADIAAIAAKIKEEIGGQQV